MVQVEGMKLVVCNSTQLDHCRRLVHRALGRAVRDWDLHTSSHQEVTQCLKDIRVSVGSGQPATDGRVRGKLGSVTILVALPSPSLPSLPSLPSRRVL